jgi:hypothetical protein
MVIPPTQSIGGNNDGTYVMYVAPHSPCAWIDMSAMIRHIALRLKVRPNYALNNS